MCHLSCDACWEVWERQCFEDIFTKDYSVSQWIIEFISDKGVSWTALATSVLLIINRLYSLGYHNQNVKLYFLFSSLKKLGCIAFMLSNKLYYLAIFKTNYQSLEGYETSYPLSNLYQTAPRFGSGNYSLPLPLAISCPIILSDKAFIVKD